MSGVPVLAEVATLIAQHVESRSLEPNRLLFENSARGPIYERNLVQRSFKPLLQRSELPDIRLYDLRHTFAVWALDEGAPARLVSEQLGHRSVACTFDVYGHVLEETCSEAADRLATLLSPRRIADRKPLRVTTDRLVRSAA
jgi:integrase